MGKYTMLKNDDRLKTGAWIMVRNKKKDRNGENGNFIFLRRIFYDDR